MRAKIIEALSCGSKTRRELGRAVGTTTRKEGQEPSTTLREMRNALELHFAVRSGLWSIDEGHFGPADTYLDSPHV
uniref:Uncharacterized protein n=1 Tax=Bosea sp. NBC_00436 TaxID=2969620 RepID=A0A9E8A6V2_9HYPH